MMSNTYIQDLIKRCENCKELDFASYLMSKEHFTVSSSSTRRKPVLKDPLNGYHYIIKNNPLKPSQYQAYITEQVLPDGTTNFSKKHITLIDYIMMKYHLNLGEAVLHIESNAGIMAPLLPVNTKRSEPAKQPKRVVNINDLKPYSDTYYLSELRKIDSGILQEPVIKNALRNITVQNHNNTAFPMKNQDGQIITWCEKNAVAQPDGTLKSWQSFPEKSTIGLLFLTEKPAFTRYVVFSETPIDAISYYQVNHELLKDSTLIVSSCGNINPEMLSHLQHILQKNPQAKLIVANDFDAAGFRFDFMIASSCGGLFSASDSITPFFHPIQTAAGSHSFFKCTFLSGVHDDLSGYRNSLELYSMSKQLPFEVSSIEQVNTGEQLQHTFNIQFSFNLRHSKLLLTHFCDYFRLHTKIHFDKPGRGLKDWNLVVSSGKYETSSQLQAFCLNPYNTVPLTENVQGQPDEVKKKGISR
jgi:hypothetical protein